MSRRLQHELEKTFVDRTNCHGLWVCFDAVASGCLGGHRHRSPGRISISVPPLPLSLLRRAGSLLWAKLLLVARAPRLHTAAPPLSPGLVVSAAGSSVVAR